MNALTSTPLRLGAPRSATTAAPTESREQAGSMCPGLSQCQKLGPADPRQQVQVSVLLKRPVEYKMPSGSMSRADLARYGATPAQTGSVKQFAKDNGLSVASVDAGTRTVKLQGTVAQLNQAFGVQLNRYQDQDGNEFRGYNGKVQLPASLGGQVAGVFGLSNRPLAQSQAIIGPAVKGGGYAPTQVAQMYNFPQGTDGSGQTIGIIELGGGYQDADLQQYFKSQGITAPSVSSVSVDGAQNAPTGKSNGPDGEVDLDIEVAGSVAPGAKVVVYYAPNTEQGFIDAINQAAHDNVNKPNVLSISWGAPESQWTADGLANMNSAFKDAAALGVNVFAASGDHGSKDGEKDGKNHADFPASSPWTLGCGGTRLKSAGNEVAWNDGFLGGAGGGGVSDVFPASDWQKAGATLPAPTAAAGGRGVPDVAGNADPMTGYNVLVDGSSMSIGGTSAVAPLWAALAARLGQGVGAPLGFLGPILYRPDVAGDFHDITKGNNGGFKAGPGWDAVTGLGSPDGQKLLDSLQALHHSVG